jgi:hypothetical protein
LPLPSETIDDLVQTERAAHPAEDVRFFHDPSAAIKGLVYPDEMLAPIPVIWLQGNDAAVAQGEAAELEGLHGLPAIVE